MTVVKVDVESYEDLRGDAVIHSRAKDAILRELDDGADAVLWLEEWLVPKKSFSMLGSVSGLDQIVAGRVVAETEGDEDSDGAYLFTQTDDDDPAPSAPGTDWVPRGYSRLYVDATDDGDDVDATVPQRGLGDFAEE